MLGARDAAGGPPRRADARRKAILPRRCLPVEEADGGTETVVNSQLSRISFYKRFLLQSTTLSFPLPPTNGVHLRQNVKLRRPGATIGRPASKVHVSCPSLARAAVRRLRRPGRAGDLLFCRCVAPLDVPRIGVAVSGISA